MTQMSDEQINKMGKHMNSSFTICYSSRFVFDPSDLVSFEIMITKATLFYFAAVLALAAVSVADKKHDHGNIHGYYTLDSNLDSENANKFVDAMGFNELVRQGMRATKKLLLVISGVNDTHCNIKKIAELGTIDTTFESGKEFEEDLPDGRTVKTSITLDYENQTLLRVYKMDGFEASCFAKFSSDGMTVTNKAKDAVAKINFKRCPKSMCGDVVDGDHSDLEAIKKKYFAE